MTRYYWSPEPVDPDLARRRACIQEAYILDKQNEVNNRTYWTHTLVKEHAMDFIALHTKENRQPPQHPSIPHSTTVLNCCVRDKQGSGSRRVGRWPGMEIRSGERKEQAHFFSVCKAEQHCNRNMTRIMENLYDAIKNWYAINSIRWLNKESMPLEHFRWIKKEKGKGKKVKTCEPK